jgi:hypothetical protein
MRLRLSSASMEAQELDPVVSKKKQEWDPTLHPRIFYPSQKNIPSTALETCNYTGLRILADGWAHEYRVMSCSHLAVSRS